ncbi:hypothetical protein NDU88_003564 [Pleurodeles waltl]|uniref:Endonuclease/exonuclease/phosphatase domain-containing protein n=1 Tax=Pleurodeles waltl TaxID=8319 RepID=A0AAV7WPF4_PLEWA|nr:hypothetical protein NDU88_003564 [Pleurodeles waltl]
MIDGKAITLLNVYVANVDDKQFYDRIQDLLEDSAGTPVVWAGDFNCLLDGDAVRHPPKQGAEPLMTSSLAVVMRNLGFRDTWRDMHPDGCKFTCLTHNTYSRLDRIPVGGLDIQKLVGVKHLGWFRSEHVPLLLTLQWGTDE